MPEPSVHRTGIRSDLPQIVEIYNSRFSVADRDGRYRARFGREPGALVENTRPIAGLFGWSRTGSRRGLAQLSTFYGRPATPRRGAERLCFTRRSSVRLPSADKALAHRDVRATRAGVHIRTTTNQPCVFRRFGFSGGGRCQRSLCWTESNATSSSSEDAWGTATCSRGSCRGALQYHLRKSPGGCMAIFPELKSKPLASCARSRPGSSTRP